MTAAHVLPLPEVAGAGSAVSGPNVTVTFVHTADWQLGMTRRFLDADAQARFTASRIDGIGRIGGLARAHHAEFVLVCGDVFEDHQVSPQVVRRALDEMGDIGLPVYLLPGNHDPLDRASIYRASTFERHRPANVHVLDAGVTRIRDGVELVAAPWTSKRPLTDLLADQVTRLPHHDAVRIVAGHGIVDALDPTAANPAAIGVSGLQEALADGLIDYVALGDRHSVTDIGDSGRIWYSGAHEVTDFDSREADPGHALVVTASRSAVQVQRHSVGQWTFRSIETEINTAADVESLAAQLESIPAKSRSVLRLRLSGVVSLETNTVLEELLETAADRFAAVQRWTDPDRRLLLEPTPDDLARLGLTGYASATADELAAASAADASARDALALLYRLASECDS
ncbi:metallophosphoesterase family protein [Jongsikchunia kroppenstedtii]|uniref:metallophosphoesterase family protein n=1 Tax=Jongsikchunia kroppenstedtii TaxID=1121721 RepID=UPI00035F665A|nr:metallophosphoesterase [Jongsikchunia kroppenstedtii]